ncbi:MAG: pyridoxal phosphate-dependent aminotransferase [Suilimivivens sp.]
MISPKFQEMLNGESVIRKMSSQGNALAEKIGRENVFDYSIGNPSVPAPADLNDVFKELLDNKDPLELHGYSESHGILEVRKQIADSLKRRFGIPYTYNDIFMASGAGGAMAHAIRAVVCPGEEIITFAPYFPEYAPYAEGAGVLLKVIPADTETFQINFEALENEISEKTAAVLINTPNNPSGVVYSTATIMRLSELLRSRSKEYGHTIYLISDEPYREIVFEGVDSPYVSAFYENTIVCYSFSKSLSLPGERIGYVAVNPACQDAEMIIHMCAQISRCTGHNCPSSIIQYVVGKMIDETSDLSVYEKNSKILYKELKTIGFTCQEPGGTFYMFPKALEEDSVAFCQKALEYRLVLVPGDSFGCPGYFRISYCVPTEKVERSLQAFRELAKAYGL